MAADHLAADRDGQASLSIAPARRRRLLITSGLILGNELMERLAYYSLSTDLVTRLDMLGARSAEAASATMVWQGTCYLVSIFGAWTADAFLGRYWTIVVFSAVYLLGLAGVVLSTGVAALGSRAWLMAALYIVALGTGGIKANVSSFGADQFDDACPAEAAAKSRYFNAFYFVINVGALVASLFVVNVQSSVSWLVGYAIPAAAFAAAFAFFLAGTPLYVHVAPRGSPFVRLGAVFAAAAAKWRVSPPADAALLYESDSDEDEDMDGVEAAAALGDAAGKPGGLLQSGRGWSAGARLGPGEPLAPAAPPSRRASVAGDDDSADGGGWVPPPSSPPPPRDAAAAAESAALAVHHDPPLRLPSGLVRAAVRSERQPHSRARSASAGYESGWAGTPRPLSAGVVSRAASSVAGALSRAGSVGAESCSAPATPGSGAIASASAAAAAAAAAASGVRRRARAEASASAAAATTKLADNQAPTTAFVPPASRRLAHTTFARWLDKAATPLALYYKSAAAAGVAHPPPPGGPPLCCCAAPLGPDDAVYECGDDVAGKTVADLAAGATGARRARLPGAPRPPRERHLCSVTQTEETKRMLSFLPICLCTVVFSAVYAQMSSTFVLQGRFMDRHVGGLTISSATLSAFNTIAVLICVPLYDMVVVPFVRRLRHGRAPTYLQRIGGGLGLSVLTMAVAAGVEAWRLGLAARGAPPPSIFVLTAQYALVGASEVCTQIGLMELCYSEAPDSMRSLASALQLVTGAVGSFLSSAIVAAVEATSKAYTGRGWLPDLDEGYEGRLDLFYVLLMVISAVNLAFFIPVAASYQYKVLAGPSVRAGKAGLAALAAAERAEGGGEGVGRRRCASA